MTVDARRPRTKIKGAENVVEHVCAPTHRWINEVARTSSLLLVSRQAVRILALDGVGAAYVLYAAPRPCLT